MFKKKFNVMEQIVEKLIMNTKIDQEILSTILVSII